MVVKVATPEAYLLMHRGSVALARVERNGIRVDESYLDTAMEKLGRKIKKQANRMMETDVWETWRRQFGQKAKLTSHEQLGKILFGVLKYPVVERTEKGRPKTDVSALEAVPMPFAQDYVKLQKMMKTRGTFLTGIRRETVDGFLHPVFNLNLVETFRSSSDSPNFQNLPKRDPEVMRIVRRCFVPRRGCNLIEVDYSGIEVRVAACYHKDPVMMAYIRDKSKDMHRDMAAQIYKIKPEQVTDAARHTGKNMFVFPQFYGDYYVNCARAMWEECARLGIKTMEETGQEGVLLIDHLEARGITALGACDPKEGAKPGTFEHWMKQVEHDFWNNRFRVYGEWKESWWRRYLERGYIRMYTGFVVQGSYRKNQIINYPVQGPAFHCLLESLIRLQNLLRKNRMKSLIVGQIHDSMLADVPPAETQDYLHMAKETMTQTIPKLWSWINVPLEIGVDVSPEGTSWAEKRKCKEVDGMWKF